MRLAEGANAVHSGRSVPQMDTQACRATPADDARASTLWGNPGGESGVALGLRVTPPLQRKKPQSEDQGFTFKAGKRRKLRSVAVRKHLPMWLSREPNQFNRFADCTEPAYRTPHLVPHRTPIHDIVCFWTSLPTRTGKTTVTDSRAFNQRDFETEDKANPRRQTIPLEVWGAGAATPKQTFRILGWFE